MNKRKFVLVLYSISFLIGLAVVAYLLKNFWEYMLDWEVALYIYYLLLGFCGIAIAYWMVEDEEKIENLKKRIQRLEKEKK